LSSIVTPISRSAARLPSLLHVPTKAENSELRSSVKICSPASAPRV